MGIGFLNQFQVPLLFSKAGEARPISCVCSKNWEYTTLVLLKEHYTMGMKAGINTLSVFEDPEWQGPYQVASSWARRNLGRRIEEETLVQAQDVILCQLTETPPTHRLPAFLPAVALTAPRESSYAPTSHTTTRAPSSVPPSQKSLATTTTRRVTVAYQHLREAEGSGPQHTAEEPHYQGLQSGQVSSLTTPGPPG